VSYALDIGGHTVWSPALRVGTLYVGFSKTVSDEYGIPLGFRPIANDTVEIDPVIFGHFVDKLMDAIVESNHEILRQELLTIVLPGIVMLDRGAHPVADRTEARKQLIADAHEMGRSMPR
jgi:hypothetical protein